MAIKRNELVTLKETYSDECNKLALEKQKL